MSIIGLLITALLPASAVVCIAVKKRVPVYALVAVFFVTAVSLFPVLALQHFVHTFFDTIVLKQSEAVRLFFNSFITAALTEEGVKAACFGLTVALLSKKRSYPTQEKNDRAKTLDRLEGRNRQARYLSFYHRIILAVFFGFIFSGFENISYSLRYPTVQFLRVFTAAVLHGILGCFYASMTYVKAMRKATLIFITAVILHGLYNFFISLGGGFILPATAVLGIAYLYVRWLFSSIYFQPLK